jgi:hypothetical protein
MQQHSVGKENIATQTLSMDPDRRVGKTIKSWGGIKHQIKLTTPEQVACCHCVLRQIFACEGFFLHVGQQACNATNFKCQLSNY